MNSSIRLSSERRELDSLSPYAAKAAESAGRPRPDSDDPVRTAYQRDRDRILHSKSFRRLKRKTQVFIDPVGDHYRTRMTHSLEVSQVARTVGRALRLNEDLIEAIALGHDMGHTPFGHAGEQALDDALGEWHRMNPGCENDAPKAFSHHEQSLRVVDVLEDLNLTHETRLGIGGHSKGHGDLTAHDGTPTSTLEAAVVRVSDRIAYLNHDLDDAIRAGLIEKAPGFVEALGDDHGRRIGAMVEDLIVNSMDKPAIVLSPPMLACLNEMKDWLFDHVYWNYPVRYPDVLKAQGVVRELFTAYLEPGRLPEGYQGVQGSIDYVAGMTDRFAIETYKALKLPDSWRLP